MRHTQDPNGLTAITAADEAAILELNNAHEIELSRLDVARLRQLLAAAYHARMAPQGVAFLIAFAPDADYDGVHFSWFRDRFDDFVLMYAAEGGVRSARPGHRPCLVCRPLSARAVRWSFHDLLRGQRRPSKSRIRRLSRLARLPRNRKSVHGERQGRSLLHKACRVGESLNFHILCGCSHAMRRQSPFAALAARYFGRKWPIVWIRAIF